MAFRIVLYSVLNVLVSFGITAAIAKAAGGGRKLLWELFPFFIPMIVITALWIVIAWQMKLKGNIRVFVPFLLLAVYLFYQAVQVNGNYFGLVLFPIQFAFSLLVLKQTDRQETPAE